MDLALADFLFRGLKNDLVDISLDENTIKKQWEGVSRRITAKEFATTLSWWYEHCQKCIAIGGGYVKKS
jgi:hypothetical protein